LSKTGASVTFAATGAPPAGRLAAPEIPGENPEISEVPDIGSRRKTDMRKIVALVLSVAVSASCAKTSKPDEFRSDRGYEIFFEESYYVTLDVAFEDVWSAVRMSLADLDWNVADEVESSGMIATDEQTIGTNRDPYACRQWPGSQTRIDELKCRLTVQIGTEDDLTRIRASTRIEGRYVYLSSTGEEKIGGWWECTSTGEIEGELFDAVLSRLEPLRYDPPVYRRR
jgi:hypothetical protein